MIKPITHNGKNYLPVFIAGVYPQATIDELFLMQVALNYNSEFHEAPIWLGHPGYDDRGKNEPQALAWVESLMLTGKVLYACLKEESPEFKQLIKDKKFKVWSAELVEFVVNGENKPYLFAIGLTNRPAVHGIKPFTIADTTEFTGHIFKQTDINQKYIFEQKLFSNQTQNKMKELICNLLTKLKVAFTESDTETDLVTKLENYYSGKFTELETKIANFTHQAAANSSDANAAKVTELETALANLHAERVADFVDAAAASGKIVPEQKPALIAMGKTNFAELKNFIAAQGTHPMFTKQVKTAGAAEAAASKFNFTDARYKHPKENRQVTYSDLVKDFELSGKFTTEEIEALRISELAQA